MSPDVGISDSRWIYIASDGQVRPADLSVIALEVFHQFGHRFLSRLDDHFSQCVNFGFVGLQCSHLGVVGLLGLWNGWIAQLNDAAVEELGGLDRSGQQNRPGPTRLYPESESCVHLSACE